MHFWRRLTEASASPRQDEEIVIRQPSTGLLVLQYRQLGIKRDLLLRKRVEKKAEKNRKSLDKHIVNSLGLLAVPGQKRIVTPHQRLCRHSD
jgi:hypothetical protein